MRRRPPGAGVDGREAPLAPDGSAGKGPADRHPQFPDRRDRGAAAACPTRTWRCARRSGCWPTPRSSADSPASPHALLDGEEAGLLNGLVRVERNLRAAGRDRRRHLDLAGQCSAQRLELEDLAASLGDYARESEFDPNRLAEVEERLYQLEAVKKKYGPELTDVLEFPRDGPRASWPRCCRREEEGSELEDRLADAAGRFAERAARLERLDGKSRPGVWNR